MAVPYDDRVGEVLVEMVDVLDDPVLPAAGDRHVVEHREVLDQFAQSDASGVRADGNAVLGGEQQDREVLVDARDPCGVDLDEVDRVGLQQLHKRCVSFTWSSRWLHSSATTFLLEVRASNTDRRWREPPSLSRSQYVIHTPQTMKRES